MELTIKEIKPILKHIIENNKKLESEGKMPIACELIGAAGIAKTAIIEEVAKEYDANYVKISLSQISEVGEISGYPIREHYVCKPDGDCR
jgi:ATP-dependent Lon protease